MPRGAMLRSMSSLELSQWMAFARIEPFGDARGDLQAGTVAATIANVHRKKNRKPFLASDFVMDWLPPATQDGPPAHKARAVMEKLLAQKNRE